MDGLYKGIRYNIKEQYHAFLLVECKPGDDITCDGVPEGYEEVWVRFNMEIHGRKDRGNIRITPPPRSYGRVKTCAATT